jgi:hypothetical protein
LMSARLADCCSNIAGTKVRLLLMDYLRTIRGSSGGQPVNAAADLGPWSGPARFNID